jgi:hypothetical protein
VSAALLPALRNAIDHEPAAAIKAAAAALLARLS